MEKVDLLGFGWAYELILFMLSAVVVVDAVSIAKTMSGDYEEKREYAQLCIKYLKILMCAMAGGFFLIVALTYGYDRVTSLIHGILGGLLIIDAAVCFVIKLRYGGKRR